MATNESVTEWLTQLKQGDHAAAQKVWQRYVQRLIHLARRKLGTAPRRVADENDVAIVAFASFCRDVEKGRFPRLEDRDDLWQVLIMLTDRKAIDVIRAEHADRRGGGEVRGESAVDANGSSEMAGLAQIVDDAPTPVFAAMAAEEYHRLMGALTSELMRQIAQDKMACYSNKEIAERRGASLRTVERHLSLIRKIWHQERAS